MSVFFGTAGNSDSFYEQGMKKTEQMPKWLSELGLNAYEYQCGNGVRIKEPTAKKIKEEAEKYNIRMSLHTPYYINLATPDEEKRINSVRYIMESLQASRYLGADRIVIHSGSLGKLSREEALEYAKKTLILAKNECDAAGFSDIHFCIETMGKINQLGDLDEVMNLCSLNDSFLPTIDFGHLNARSLGGLKIIEDFEQIFDTMENKLGKDRLNIFHSHFSRIEYTKGGEKRHLTFEDTVYGPDFEPVAEIIYKRGLSPVIICESRGTQTEDALTMKNIYNNISAV